MKKFLLLISLATLLISCKQENFLDWKSLNEAWLEENSHYAGVKTTPSGLQYKQLNPSPNPTESRPNYDSQIIVDYKLYLISSYGGYNDGSLLQEGTNVAFSMQQVVEGFAEGLHLMRVHDDFVLYIPYYLGYGAEGRGTEGNYGYIPPYSTLIYEIHLKAMQ